MLSKFVYINFLSPTRAAFFVEKSFFCSICDSKSGREILRKKVQETEYRLFTCLKCGQSSISPIPSLEELERFYNSSFEVPLFQEKKTIRKGIKILNELERKGFKEGSRILEIGASYGFFMNLARERGFDVSGIEMSGKACEYAAHEFNLDIENSSLEESKFVISEQVFDAIILLDVIEHVTDPRGLMENIEALLAPGGFLVITTPNIESTEFRLFGRAWEWVSPPAHLFYFSSDSLRSLLPDGLKPSHVETCRGDSGGNIVFHGIYSFIKYIFWSPIGKLVDRGPKAASDSNVTNRERRSEFTGILGMAKLFSLFFYPMIVPYDYWRNKKGRGPTLLLIAEKK